LFVKRGWGLSDAARYHLFGSGWSYKSQIPPRLRDLARRSACSRFQHRISTFCRRRSRWIDGDRNVSKWLTSPEISRGQLLSLLDIRRATTITLAFPQPRRSEIFPVLWSVGQWVVVAWDFGLITWSLVHGPCVPVGRTRIHLLRWHRCRRTAA